MKYADEADRQRNEEIRLRSRVRDTSIGAYHQLKDSGDLAKRQWEVYDLLWDYGPGTSAEIFEHTIGDKQRRTLTQSRARFTELRDMGVIQELGTVECKISGRRAILWDVTGSGKALPITRKRATMRQWREIAYGLFEALERVVDEGVKPTDAALVEYYRAQIDGLPS